MIQLKNLWKNMRKTKSPIEIICNFIFLLFFGSVVLDMYVVWAANSIFKLQQMIYERKKKQLYNKNNIYLHTNWFFHLLAFVQLIWLWIGKYDLSSQQKIEKHVKISCFVPNVQNHCICPIYHISKITLNGVTILIQWIFVNINCEYKI